MITAFSTAAYTEHFRFNNIRKLYPIKGKRGSPFIVLCISTSILWLEPKRFNLKFNKVSSSSAWEIHLTIMLINLKNNVMNSVVLNENLLFVWCLISVQIKQCFTTCFIHHLSEEWNVWFSLVSKDAWISEH